jgi:tetratricopeptide (TPR) repeat protein
MKVLLILLLTSISTISIACVNEYNTLLNGEIIFTDPAHGRFWEGDVDTTKLIEKAEYHLSSYQATGDLEQYSDYAAQLIYLGDYQKAKNIYEEIEVIKPNLYSTASNLGTIYELIGKPDSALLWIKKSIAINPESHKGSEWIHIKILENQINGSNENRSSILGLDFGNANIPANPKNYDLRELSQHITHQLRERTRFVKPKNYTVGNIYFDFGNVLAQTRDVESALQSYNAASEYGFESQLFAQRRGGLKSIASNKNFKLALENPEDFISQNREFITDYIILILIAGLLGFILFVVLLFKIVRWIIRKLRKS